MQPWLPLYLPGSSYAEYDGAIPPLQIFNTDENNTLMMTVSKYISAGIGLSIPCEISEGALLERKIA